MLNLTLGLGLSCGLVGAGSPAPKWRIADSNSRLPTSRLNSGSTNRHMTRTPRFVCADTEQMCVVLPNFYLNATAGANNYGAQSPTGNALDVVEMSLESPLGNTVSITFSGNRTVTLSNGQVKLVSDPIPALSFGLLKFSATDIYWVKGAISIPAGGYVPSHQRIMANDFAGTQYLWCDTANTSMSSVDVAGAFTSTGTAPASTSTGFNPLLIAWHEREAFLAIGDSIGEGNASGNSGVWGRSFFNIAAGNYGHNSKPLLNICVSSANLTLLTETEGWREYIGYADIAFDEFGTNSVDTAVPLLDQLTRHRSLWSTLRSAGIKKIYKTELMCRTTSTDTWATVANQTVAARWGSGEEAEQHNDAMLIELSDGRIDGIISTKAVKDPVNPYKWRCDDAATARYSTNDHLHPSSSGNVLLAWDVRLWMIAGERQDLTQIAGVASLFDARVKNTLLDLNGVPADQAGFAGSVDTWNPVIGQYPAIAADAGRRPAYDGSRMIGNVACPDFNGINNALIVNAAAMPFSALTILRIYFPDSTNTNQHVWANSGSTGSNNTAFGSNQSGNLGNNLLTRDAPTTGSPIIHVNRVNSTNPGARHRQNIDGDPGQTATSNRGNTGSQIAIGAFGNGNTQHFDGAIGLIMVVNRQMTPAEVSWAASILSADFGTSLGTDIY